MLGMEKQHASLLASKSKIMLLRHWQSPHRRWWRWMRKDCFLVRLTRWWRMVPWALVNFALTMMGRGWILEVWSLVESQSRRNTRRGLVTKVLVLLGWSNRLRTALLFLTHACLHMPMFNTCQTHSLTLLHMEVWCTVALPPLTAQIVPLSPISKILSLLKNLLPLV